MGGIRPLPDRYRLIAKKGAPNIAFAVDHMENLDSIGYHVIENEIIAEWKHVE